VRGLEDDKRLPACNYYILLKFYIKKTMRKVILPKNIHSELVIQCLADQREQSFFQVLGKLVSETMFLLVGWTLCSLHKFFTRDISSPISRCLLISEIQRRTRTVQAEIEDYREYKEAKAMANENLVL